MIQAIALDDEPPALKIVESFCSNSPKVSLHKCFTKPAEAFKFIEKYPVDLLFLDIQMPSISGIDFYKSLNKDIMVIFTTAFSEYAVEGFNLNAVDYLLKPFTAERFDQAITKASEYYNFLNQVETAQKFIFIRADYSLIKINLADILYIEGLDDYLKIRIRDKKTIVARMTMKSIIERLPASEFIRVHRSYIVSISKIEKVRNKVISINNEEIPIGMSYEEQFNSIFKT